MVMDLVSMTFTTMFTHEVETVQNYWLHEEYPYAVKQGLVEPVLYDFVGYDK